MRESAGRIATIFPVERVTVWERLRRVNPLIWDLLLALFVFGSSLFLEYQFRSNEHVRIDSWGRGLLALTCAALVWRQLAPIVALAATAVGAVALQLWGYPLDFSGLAFVIAVYSAAAHRDRGRVFLVALPIAVAAALVIYLDNRPWHRDLVQLTIDVAALVGLPMLLGRIEFNRRRRAREAVDRASRDGVTEERRWIARELHDVVAHSMGVMVVQAGAARLVVDKDPEHAAAAMTQIEQTGRAGLAEMRRLLGILENANEAAPLLPQPGLEQLDELLGTMRGTGLPVETIVEGTPRALPPGVDLTAYRIVQEALTNALKHGERAHTQVLLRYEDDRLEVEIADEGPGPPPVGAKTPGLGLIGMRERVALFGGSFETGARPGGGFAVRARIPLEAT
ncbi:MAG TPA: sensor histidine kinase [Actinomycetota bacterium]|nr:sensor histidine kinase [Actinomycetota bacterium]